MPHFLLRDGSRSRGSRRRRAAALAAVSLAVEVLGLRRSGYGLGGNVVVRCDRGHLFTTIWLPGISVKALRLGWWRVQRCPVGGHWSLVRAVDRSRLGPLQRRRAAQTRDVRLP